MDRPTESGSVPAVGTPPGAVGAAPAVIGPSKSPEVPTSSVTQANAGPTLREVELPGGPITGLGPPPTKDLEPGRDFVRAALALGLLGLLSVIVLLGFALLFWPPAALAEADPMLDARMTYLQTVLGVVAGLFGAATGFYFGAGPARK